jgi:hypothetical protein
VLAGLRAAWIAIGLGLAALAVVETAGWFAFPVRHVPPAPSGADMGACIGDPDWLEP